MRKMTAVADKPERLWRLKCRLCGRPMRSLVALERHLLEGNKTGRCPKQ